MVREPGEAVEIIDRILDHFGIEGADKVGYPGLTPYQILISVILSQQTTERNSTRASEQLFSELPTPMDVYLADQERVEELIFCSGYYRQKAKSIKAVTKKIVEGFDSIVPNDPELLMSLPSVGKKTAACVMRFAFDTPSVIVDTHINRVSMRLGISDTGKVDDTLSAITNTIPKDRWDDLDRAFITLGRTYCRPKNPDCEGCPVSDLCGCEIRNRRA